LIGGPIRSISRGETAQEDELEGPRTTRRALIASLAAGAALGASPASARSGGVVARHGRLQVRGNRIVDAHGAPITLRGSSLFWSQWRPTFYNARLVRWLKTDWHANVVRAAIAASHGGYDKDPALHTRLAEGVIDAAIAEGIYVIVDWHAHDAAADDAIRFFTHVATRYRGVPNLIYETWNEPVTQSWAKVIKPFHVAVIGAIRGIDPGAFVVAGTRSWSQEVDAAAADPLPFDHVAYALHFYAATHKQKLRDRADLALRRGAALFVTEYGVTAANGDRPIDLAETRRWWDWCETNGISHLAWSICDKAEASAALVAGASPQGGWKAEELTESGKLIRDRLRAMQ
jgi:endoglucanase